MSQTRALFPGTWFAELANADPIVLGVLALLLVLSLLTWFLIVYKAAELTWAARE